MKTKVILLVLGLILCLVLSGCGSAGTSAQASESTGTTASTNESAEAATSSAEEQSQASAETTVVAETAGASGSETAADASQELLEPVMEWWELYNPNGFDTLTAVITNPNGVDVDFSYDVVFYKDGSEVSRIEYCDSFSVAAGDKALIWINADVPAAADVDDVKLENVYVCEASDPAIGGSYEYAGVIDGYACYDFTFDSKPTLATIYFVLYNDENGNDKFDKGEISGISFSNLMEQTGRASFNVDVNPYTDADVYFTAY